MKKHFTLFFSLAACMSYQQAIAQATQSGPGNGGHLPPTTATPNTHYLGWDMSTGIDLQIRHDRDRPITFWTQGTQRMHINPGNGFVGIGNFAAPQNRLHLHETGTTASVFSQWTTGATGTVGTTAGLDGLRIGLLGLP